MDELTEERDRMRGLRADLPRLRDALGPPAGFRKGRRDQHDAFSPLARSDPRGTEEVRARVRQLPRPAHGRAGSKGLKQSGWPGSNGRPRDPRSRALPTAPHPVTTSILACTPLRLYAD